MTPCAVAFRTAVDQGGRADAGREESAAGR